MKVSIGVHSEATLCGSGADSERAAGPEHRSFVEDSAAEGSAATRVGPIEPTTYQ